MRTLIPLATEKGPVPAPGERVMVRHRLPPGASHPMTDVLGTLTGRDPVTVQTRDGREVRIAESDVVSLRAIPPAPVRTRDVRALEHAAALAWPGTEHTWLDGWFLRAGHGFTGRANSCVPLGEAPDDGVARVRAWYAARGLPARLVVADRMDFGLRHHDLPGFDSGERVQVLTAGTTAVAAAADARQVEVHPDLDEAWLRRYRYRGAPAPSQAPALLRAVVDGTVGFASIRRAGEVLAVGRGAVTTDPHGARWLGLTALEVAPTARRQGLGAAVCAGLAAWGDGHGAQRVYLQVAADNVGALRMYDALGFTLHHGYHYATAP